MKSKISLLLTFSFINLLPALLLGQFQQPSMVIPTPPIHNACDEYDKYEVSFSVVPNYPPYSLYYINPYDPDEIEVHSDFISPTGKHYLVNGFFYKEVTSNGCLGGPNSTGYWYEEDKLVPDDKGCWKIRFTPNEIGDWKYTILAHDAGGTTISSTYSFQCNTISESPSNKGFITIANQRYFKFDNKNQDPFYPVGDNLPFWGTFNPSDWSIPPTPNSGMREEGVCALKKKMDDHANHNMNFFLYDINYFESMNIFGIDYQDGKNYYRCFNQRDSWQLDQIMDYAHGLGIYLTLSLFSHKDLGNNAYNTNHWTDFNPFNINNQNQNFNYPDGNGNCATPFDFLTGTDALKVQKNLLRYIIARWGYSNNIMSWELMDEVDQFDNLSANVGSSTRLIDLTSPTYQADQTALTNNIIKWHKDTKNYINSIDPFKHLVCTGTMWNDPLNPNTRWDYQSKIVDYNPISEAMDFSQGKNYVNQLQGDLHCKKTNIEQRNFDVTHKFNGRFFKPFYMVETNYRDGDIQNCKTYDPHMYCLHGMLWSSFFSGSIGPNCLWAYQDMDWVSNTGTTAPPLPIDNYKGIGNFISSLPLLSEKYEPISDTNVQTSGLKMYGLKSINNDIYYGWVQDRNYDYRKLLWRNTANANGQTTIDSTPVDYLIDLSTNPPSVSSSDNSIKLPVGKNGLYKIRWYNTETGEEYLQQNTYPEVQSTTSNTLTIHMPQHLRFNNLQSSTLSRYGDAAFIVEYQCSGQWNNTVLNSNAPSNALPTGAVQTDLQGNVFFVGDDQRLHIMYFNGTMWIEAALNINAPHNVKVNSDLARGGPSDQINFVSINNTIRQYYYANNMWNETALIPNEPQNVHTNSPLVCDQTGNVYFIAYDNLVHNYSYNQVTHQWNQSALSNSAYQTHARQDSDLAMFWNNNIYFVGTDGRIHEYYWDLVTNVWIESVLNSSNPPDVAPGSSLACDAYGRIYFVALDGRIHRYYFDNVTLWNEEDFFPNAPTNVIKLNSEITISDDGQIFFVGNDNRVHNYWTDGTNWYEATLNNNDPVNASIHLTTNNNNIFYASNDISGCGNRIYVDYFGCQANFKSLSNSNNEVNQIKENQIKLFPNPNDGNFSIEINVNDGSEALKIEVFDLMGQLVNATELINTESSSTKSTNLDLSYLSSGMYYLKLTSSSSSYFKKFNIIK